MVKVSGPSPDISTCIQFFTVVVFAPFKMWRIDGCDWIIPNEIRDDDSREDGCFVRDTEEIVTQEGDIPSSVITRFGQK